MEVVSLTALWLALFGGLVYTIAGGWAARRTRGNQRRADLALARANRRALAVLVLGSAAAVLHLWRSEPVLSPVARTVCIYLGPLLWCWGVVLGSTRVELRSRGLTRGLVRFHRFNLFSAYLLVGQRIPFLSAAFAAPADLTAGWDLFPALAWHFGIATLLGWAVRWVIVSRVAGVCPLPDSRLAVEVRAAARDAGVHLRAVLLVPTERGQSVNALAATTSRIVYVAEGLWRGLDREEVRAVLLHEAGHLGQRWTNLYRDLTILGWPAILWGLRAIPMLSLTPRDTALWCVGLGAAGILGTILTWWIGQDSERRADQFAGRWGSSLALASALRKMYALGGETPAPGMKSRRGQASLAARLMEIEG